MFCSVGSIVGPTVGPESAGRGAISNLLLCLSTVCRPAMVNARTCAAVVEATWPWLRLVALWQIFRHVTVLEVCRSMLRLRERE